MNTQSGCFAVPYRRRGGTRIWVVFWIVLAALFVIGNWFPISHIPGRALKSEAQSACKSVLYAAEAFQSDYKRLPLPLRISPDKDLDFTSASHSGVLAILKGMDTTSNLRGVDYLGEFKDAKILKDRPFNGVWRESETAISLYDPWGRPYFLRFDGDGDGGVADPSKPGRRVIGPLLIWSAGKDGDPDTWADNVGSFEFAR